ncbi:hypothetical protein CYY_005638 [Polysphondylium violaceum]|uniref:DUF1289 domain-containing protein n=1 Tax=Polysphondylium violaceum TaxID=133409 RepID=A0A8J4PTX4_9MYCE|nr:hypothetical protein CYY_005638 [Polysphondylium violaceum]
MKSSMEVMNKFGQMIDVSSVTLRTGYLAGKPIKTPCVNVCRMDNNSGLCLGCARDKSEIGFWSSMTEKERDDVIADLPNRKKYIVITEENKFDKSVKK